MYHQQHVAMATSLGDKRMVSLAMEMLGDSYMLKEDYENAVKQYEAVVNACSDESDAR
jgi:predicted negative regulator of RcsB-dependent stress response